MSPVDASSAIEQHTTTRVVLIACAAALGGFLFGFDTAVINGAVEAIRSDFKLDATLIGFAVSCASARRSVWASATAAFAGLRRARVSQGGALESC